jgi:acetylornithine deacetylase/succinyl-diaminopimelate desuccinylase-like protein
VDPLSLWSSDPFEPELREGRLYARGAEDNKGQTFAFLKAVEALVQHNLLRRPLKILIEGEEECGSRGLSASLPRLSPSLQSDILMVCDTGTPDQRYSTLTMGLRGLISMEVVLHGPHRDLHSGVHGGMVRNPAAELARIVGSLHLPSGRIAVPGFYDGVAELSERDRSLANGAPFDLDRYREEVGVVANGGEAGYSWAERRGLRPTLEVNGIYGGYTGKGGKTIIPSAAGVKLTARLVQGQDPARTLAAVLAYIQSLVPEGLRLEVVDSAVAGGAFSLATSSPRVAQVRSILEKVTGEGTTVCMWEGASIPIIPELAKSAGGAEPILVGYGLEEDAIHAPNESFSLAQFRRVFLYSALFLSEIR